MILNGENGEFNRHAHRSKTMLMISTLLIQPLLPVYGTPVISYTLRAYLKAGWNIYFIVPFKPKPTDNELSKQIHIIWFAIPLLRNLVRLRKIGFFVHIAWWIITQVLFVLYGLNILIRYKIDLIYTWDVDSSPAAWILSRLFGIPWIARYLGLGSDLYVQIEKKLWKIRFWQQFVAYKLPAEMVIMTNDGTRGDIILEKLGANKRKMRFWINGVNKQLFSALPSKELAKQTIGISEEYVIIVVSRLDSQKRVDRSISVMPGIISQIPKVTMLIVGDGPERQALEKFARQLGVIKHVRFVGAVRHEKVPFYLAAADVFLSLYDISNLGNPLLEAMIAGKCCVVLNEGATSDVIHHGVTGILVEKEQLIYLDKILVSILKDQQLRSCLGENAKNWALQHLKSWDERLEQELQEVEKIVFTRNTSQLGKKRS